MKKYEVKFLVAGQIEVECDDQPDAKEFVENVGHDQLARWLFCRAAVRENGAQVVAIKEIDN